MAGHGRPHPGGAEPRVSLPPRGRGTPSGEAWDLVVVGAGIYGACVAMEAARRGLRPLVLERGTAGGETSANNLRIVHGGLRYLQTLDLPRFRESVAERSWFLREFPERVRPLPCVMPLYGRGLRRRPVMGAALAVNDLLSRGRNRGLRTDRILPDGRVLSRDETLARLPFLPARGLEGAALWHDALLEDPVAVTGDVLARARAGGADVLEGLEVVGLLAPGGRVAGVEAEDAGGARHTFAAPVVVNAAGPWSRALARRLDRDVPELFRPSLAFNLLLDVAPPFEGALAVSRPAPGAPVHFLVGSGGGLMAGTVHAPLAEDAPAEPPSRAQVRAFLEELEAALPGLGLGRADVRRVLWGRLPVSREGTTRLSRRPVLVDHGAHGGPDGLHSVSGVKFTTARRVAADLLARVAFAGRAG